MFYGSRWNVIYLNKQFCSTNTWAHIEECALFLLSYDFGSLQSTIILILPVAGSRQNRKEQLFMKGSLECATAARRRHGLHSDLHFLVRIPCILVLSSQCRLPADLAQWKLSFQLNQFMWGSSRYCCIQGLSSCYQSSKPK